MGLTMTEKILSAHLVEGELVLRMIEHTADCSRILQRLGKSPSHAAPDGDRVHVL